MKYLSNHIRTAAIILDRYDGLVPLSAFLKDYYRQHKNMGSRDRKTVSHICYGYYRCFHLFRDDDLETAIVKSLYYCFQSGNDFLQQTQLNALLGERKLEVDKLPGPAVEPAGIFPFTKYLSESIDAEAFARSLLVQPDLFLRIRPGHQENVLARLAEGGHVATTGNTTVRLNNTVNVQEKISVNSEAVIQDVNSQHVLDYLDSIARPGFTYHVWDCCAASGGKSILIADKLENNLKLTVSDIRKSILEKLKARLASAGIGISRQFVADLTAPYSSAEKYDIIIADMPCTGSGTWSRTPEQLAFFKPGKIKGYADKQFAIASNIIPSLKDGGYLFYITCSVFKEENEPIITRIKEENHLELLHMEYLEGYNIKADSLFVAVFRKKVIDAQISG